MKIRSLGFLALSLLACAPLPEDTGGLSQAGGADPDTVYVWIDPSWGRSDSIQILDEMVRLRPVGRRFVMALTIESAYLRVNPYASATCDAWGRVDWPTRTAYVNPACAPHAQAFRAVVGHEMLALLGMHNVCRRFQEVASCSSVGTGVAVMNALPVEELAPVDRQPGGWQDTPTWLDAGEFERVQGQSSVHPY